MERPRRRTLRSLNGSDEAGNIPPQSFRINSRSAGFVTRHTCSAFRTFPRSRTSSGKRWEGRTGGHSRPNLLPGNRSLRRAPMLLPCLVLPPSYRAPKLTRRNKVGLRTVSESRPRFQNRLPSCRRLVNYRQATPSSTRSIRFSFGFLRAPILGTARCRRVVCSTPRVPGGNSCGDGRNQTGREGAPRKLGQSRPGQ